MRSKTIRTLLIATQLLLLWPAWAGAAVYPQPPAVSAFTLTGFIQAATLDTPADILSGGTVTVNGTKVTIPKNTIVIMSASNITWQEVWAFAPCPWGLLAGTGPAGGQNVPVGACPTGGNGMTGLALSDKDPTTGKVPLTTYEITILGNRIGTGTADPDYVAGLVYLAQQSLNLGQGFINYIDYATGTLHVGGVRGTAGPRDTLVQINDPVGRFGRVMSPDPRFTADTDNPTISAKTGYPMCIPRAVPPPAVLPTDPKPAETDPLCPQANRPLDPNPALPAPAPLGNFTLCNPGTLYGTTCNFNAPPPVVGLVNAVALPVAYSDATSQAPFQVGDYIEYSGTLQQDDLLGTATGVPAVGGVPTKYISAWQIVGNVGIYTVPGAVPAYLNIVLTVLGVGGTPITAPLPVPEEVTTKIRTRGFFTDPTRTVDLFAVQVDPCTGAEAETLMLGGIPNQKGGVPWGRWRDVDQAGLFPVSRQWRARYTPIFTDPNFPGHPNLKAANGLDAMTFTIPVNEYITPENLVYGDPTLLVVPQNFQDFPFLVQGEGPWARQPACVAGQTCPPAVVGQLTPFPLTNSIPGLTPPAPAAFTCPTNPQPVVTISPANQTVAQNTTVTLSASASPATDLFSFLWVQNSGPAVVLSTPTAATTTFKAPNVTANTGLTFQVTATDTTTGQQATATTLVEVTPKKLPTDTVTIAPGGIVYRASRGVLNATATSSDTTCSAVLTIQAYASNGATILPANTLMGSPTHVVGGCSYTFVSGKAVFPPAGTTLDHVTVISSLGGSASATVANGELVIK